MNKFTKFVGEIKDDLGSNCYLAIISNDDSLDVEVEINEGSIAGSFPTGVSTLSMARKVADKIEKEISSRGINVFKTRKSWEDFLEKQNDE